MLDADPLSTIKNYDDTNTLKGDDQSWREWQLELERWRDMDLSAAEKQLQDANAAAQGLTHRPGTGIPVYADDASEENVKKIIRWLNIGSHIGRVGA